MRRDLRRWKRGGEGNRGSLRSRKESFLDIWQMRRGVSFHLPSPHSSSVYGCFITAQDPEKVP